MRVTDTLPEVQVTDDDATKLQRLKEANRREGYCG